MPPPVSASRKFPRIPVLIGALAVALIMIAALYLNRSAPSKSAASIASSQEKAYVHNLELSDVDMKATENFMQQQVVEVQGKVLNKGSKPIRTVEVYCLFYGVNGREIYRERVPMVRASNNLLKPGEVQPFRLPFDSLPEGWNQAMPRLVIAHIAFA